MSFRRFHSLPVSLIPLLLLSPLAEAECYVAAYGLIGNQDGWLACPGTESASGKIETCCLPGSECGEDSLCHVPASDNPGNNAWYQAGCTDPKYADPICRKNCADYTQSYVQYEDSSQLWICCGDGGCNGTVTDDTFQAVSPQDWQVIKGDSPPPKPTPSPPSPPKPPSPPGGLTSSSAVGITSTTSSTSVSSYSSSATTTSHVPPSSADFKPSPTSSSSTDASIAKSSAAPSADSKHRSTGLSTGVQAAIGVTTTVAGLALVAALAAIHMFRKNRRPEEMIDEKRTVSEQPPPPYPRSYPKSYTESVELQSVDSFVELPTDPPRNELPDANYGYRAYSPATNTLDTR